MSLAILVDSDVRRLAAALAQTLSDAPSAPYEVEGIVTQGRGTTHWLTLELARHFGSWSQGAGVYPRRFCRALVEGHCLRRAQPQVDPWSVAGLVPAIHDLLPGLVERSPEFGPVREYLGTPLPFEGEAGVGAREAGALRLLGLAESLAEVFDGYLAESPEMIRAWERGDDAPEKAHRTHRDHPWQRALWSALRARIPEPVTRQP